MEKEQLGESNKKSTALTIAGSMIMILMTLTKTDPSTTIAGYCVLVGIAFFFITEAAEKAKGDKSGLRFNTILKDIKKPGVLLWMIIPLVSAALSFFLGDLLFGGEFASHVLGRTEDILSFDKIPLLALQVIVAAWGEEIAFRGFLFGKTAKLLPIWLCAVLSSLIFAAGHISAGDTAIVIYDAAGIFIDSIVFSVIYYKTQNCMMSTFSHILGNTVGMILVFVL